MVPADEEEDEEEEEEKEEDAEEEEGSPEIETPHPVLGTLVLTVSWHSEGALGLHDLIFCRKVNAAFLFVSIS